MSKQITETLRGVRAGVKNRVLALRSFERQVNKEEFQIAFDASSDVDKIELFAILKSTDKTKLKSWIHKLVRGKLDYMSYRSLRDWAKEENIPYWSRMSKEEIVEALKKVTANEASV
jgi:hypothetical protein